MKFTLVVHAGPIDSQGSDTALRFARALLSAGHEIHRVFFYRAGVYNANAYTLAPQDERSLPDAWQALANSHQLDMVVCIAAAVRRGIVNEKESSRYDKSGDNLAESMELSGLGQLIAASIESDRVITFGGRG